MAEAPPESNAPGAFPFVLLVRFAETCVLADPAAVDELYLHVFCSCSVVCFVRVCCRDICVRVHFNFILFTRLKSILYEYMCTYRYSYSTRIVCWKLFDLLFLSGVCKAFTHVIAQHPAANASRATQFFCHL